MTKSTELYFLEFSGQDNPDADGVAVVVQPDPEKIRDLTQLAVDNGLTSAVVDDDTCSMITCGELWEDVCNYQSCIAQRVPRSYAHNHDYCEAKLHVRPNGQFYWQATDRYKNCYYTRVWTFETLEKLKRI